jgi:hypothetical protein
MEQPEGLREDSLGDLAGELCAASSSSKPTLKPKTIQRIASLNGFWRKFLANVCSSGKMIF